MFSGHYFVPFFFPLLYTARPLIFILVLCFSSHATCNCLFVSVFNQRFNIFLELLLFHYFLNSCRSLSFPHLFSIFFLFVFFFSHLFFHVLRHEFLHSVSCSLDFQAFLFSVHFLLSSELFMYAQVFVVSFGENQRQKEDRK